MNDKPEQLTAAEKTQLETELAQLEGAGRADVVQAIKTARAFGDLSENYEYHAAKNEQGLLERRITILQDRLRRAVVVDETSLKSDVVGISSKVTIEHEDGETMDVEISSVGGVSPDSPLGAALLGKKVGDKVTVKAPKSTWRATVVSITR
jgi:transcription elongation factor GreA